MLLRLQSATVRLSRTIGRAWQSEHFDLVCSCLMFLMLICLVIAVLAQPPAACTIPQ